MKVGIRLGSLGTGSLKKDIQRAMAIGVHGLQLCVVDNELDPRDLSRGGREELADYVESFGFEIPALCGDLGGFREPASLDARVSRTLAMLDLCVDLRVPLLTIRVGAIPEKSAREYQELCNVVRELGSHALNRDVRLAISTGTEPLEALGEFLGVVKSEGLRINLDPGALCANGFDACADTKCIARLVAHVQARDAVRGTLLAPGDERAVGTGDAGFDAIMTLLRNAEYRGFVTVAHKDDAILGANVVAAVSWLKRQDGIEP